MRGGRSGGRRESIGGPGTVAWNRRRKKQSEHRGSPTGRQPLARLAPVPTATARWRPPLGMQLGDGVTASPFTARCSVKLWTSAHQP